MFVRRISYIDGDNRLTTDITEYLRTLPIIDGTITCINDQYEEIVWQKKLCHISCRNRSHASFCITESIFLWKDSSKGRFNSFIYGLYSLIMTQVPLQFQWRGCLTTTLATTIKWSCTIVNVITSSSSLFLPFHLLSLTVYSLSLHDCSVSSVFNGSIFFSRKSLYTCTRIHNVFD